MTFRSLALASCAASALATSAMAATEINMINCGGDDGAEVPLQVEAIAAWTEANPDYTVNVEYVPWGQCQEKSITLASAGDAPAAAYMGSRVLKQLAESELIRPFDLTAEEEGSYESSVLGTVKFDDKVWGLPRAFSTKALYFNKALFAEAGLDMPEGPKTFDEVMTACKAIVEKTDAACIGLAAADFDNTMHQFLNWMYSNGGKVLNDDGSVAFNSPEVIETLQFMADLAPYAQEGPLAYDRAKLEPLFREGQVAMYVNGGWGRAQVGDVDYGLAYMPAGPSGAHSTLLITDSLVVFEGTGVEDATADLVKFLTSTERQAAFDEAAGWTPIRQTATSDALIEKDPTWEVFIKSIPSGGPEPSLVDYVAMQDVLNKAIQDTLVGDATAEEAAAEAAEELADLLN